MKLRGNWIYDSYTLVRETDRSGATAEIATDKIRGEVGRVAGRMDGHGAYIPSLSGETSMLPWPEIDFSEFIESSELFNEKRNVY